MSRFLRAVALSVLWTLTGICPAAAQLAPDRRVGPDELGNPIVVTTIEPGLIGKFARAAGVPMGIEVAPGRPRRTKPATLTGLTVREALDAMAAADGRYEWREMNGVMVLRSAAAWERGDHPLHASVPAIQLPGIRARNALGLIAALLDGPQYKDAQLGDTKRFALRVDAGTVLDVLNATVSAHGELAWAFEAKPADAMFPFTVTLFSGFAGSGCGVPGRSPEQTVDVLRYADAPLFSAGGSASVLDRIVRTSASDRPLVVNGPFPSAVRDLANATSVPMGIEFLGPGNPPRSAEIPATGRTLRDVLDAMVAIDPRYEWREMDGVIVIRPTASWNDPQSLLFRLVPGERMHDVSPQTAIERLARQLGRTERLAGMPPGKPLSIDAPQGTVLDFANTIVRAHGRMLWTLEPTTRAGERAGYRHTFNFGVMGGGGTGFEVR